MLFNLIEHQQSSTDKIYFYVKGPSGAKHQLLINGKKKVVIKAFTDHLQTVDNVFESLED